ncbi:MAG: hypothetical protein L0Z55_01630 [Planctomycetes bacterium]|nr:hypothetical protein [Planctomycetota bacterium]
MRPFPFAVCLLSLLALTALSLRYYNQRNRSPNSAQSERAPEARNAPNGKAPAATAAPAKKEPGPRRKQQPEPAPAPAPGAASRPTPLSPERLAAIRDSAERWSFAEADGSALAAAAGDSKAHELLCEWTLRREFQRGAAEVAAPAPEQIFEVLLDNGKTLWAASARPKDAGIEIELLTGIHVTLKEWEVKKTIARTRADYFASSKDEYAAQLIEAGAGGPAAQLRAAALAFERHDRGAAERLYEAWKENSGSRALALHLPPGTEAAAAGAAAAPRAGGVEVARGATPSAGDGAGKPRAPRGDPIAANRPASKQDLIAKLRDVRERLGKRTTSTKTEAWIDALLLWEEWLELEGPSAGISAEETRSLRREIQFLRLDLIKTGEL